MSKATRGPLVYIAPKLSRAELRRLRAALRNPATLKRTQEVIEADKKWREQQEAAHCLAQSYTELYK